MSNLQQLVTSIARLRAPGGCDWDREQTLSTMRPYLLEEVYELLDAIDQGGKELEGELGDVLFIVLLLCQIGADEERFDLESVAGRINTRMIRRHPHVFGTGEEHETAGGTITAWEQTRDRLPQGSGRGTRRSHLDGVPRSLPADAATLDDLWETIKARSSG